MIQAIENLLGGLGWLAFFLGCWVLFMSFVAALDDDDRRRELKRQRRRS